MKSKRITVQKNNKSEDGKLLEIEKNQPRRTHPQLLALGWRGAQEQLFYRSICRRNSFVNTHKNL